MSGLLKADDPRVQSVRDLAYAIPFPSSAVHDGAKEIRDTNPQPDHDRHGEGLLIAEPARVDHLHRQCTELEANIAELSRKLAEAEDDAQMREDAAYTRGRKDGVGLSAGEEDKRASALAAMLEKLQHTHSDRLAQYELLALQLARTALGRIFGDEQLHAELVAAAVSNQLSKIRRELVTKIRLSPEYLGFTSADPDVEHFAGITVESDASLDADECEIDLHLGRIDLGLPGQWQRLGEFFDQLAEEERCA